MGGNIRKTAPTPYWKPPTYQPIQLIHPADSEAPH